MCSVLHLREFIKERLTAACEEIFSEVQKTVVQYEEEISRQRRLLDISRKPDTHSHITDVQQQYGCGEEEGLTEQQVCNQERNSSLDQEDSEPPQIKEEEEELCCSQEGEQLGLKQEADAFMVTLTYEKSELKKPEPKQPLSHSSPEGEIKTSHCRKISHSQRVDEAAVSESHTDTRKRFLQCDTCGKHFAFKCRLIAHMRIHTGEKPYSCVTCKKRFGKKSGLEQHIRTHTGEKRYVCSTCGKRFIWMTSFKTHMRTHTGEKPYACTACGKRFNQNVNLKSHMKIHTG